MWRGKVQMFRCVPLPTTRNVSVVIFLFISLHTQLKTELITTEESWNYSQLHSHFIRLLELSSMNNYYWLDLQIIFQNNKENISTSLLAWHVNIEFSFAVTILFDTVCRWVVTQQSFFLRRSGKKQSSFPHKGKVVPGVTSSSFIGPK